MSKECRLCPRNCPVDRDSAQKGICGETSTVRIARAALHMWEEPCFSGTAGSGTIFFSGCNLHCIFCQNGQIANGHRGHEITREELASEMLRLQNEEGANNINLVTGTHFVPQIAEALGLAKKRGLEIPILYNTSSYENVETIRALDGLVDLYLPDLKYMSSQLSGEYSHATDYFRVASQAIAEMVRQTGEPAFYDKETGREFSAEEYNDICDTYAESGKELLMKRGTVVRHLLLPGAIEDSKAIIRYLYETYGNKIFLSIMNQYTPMEWVKDHPLLSQRVKAEDYEEVIDYAIDLGIENAFIQEGDVAKESFVPEWD